MATIVERFKAKTLAAASGCWEWTSGCWEWTGYCNAGGYPHFWLNGRNGYVHHVSYELFIASIPKGLTVDHLCGNPRCVNPDHLEALTIRENVLRGVGYGAENSRKTHCKAGHDFTPENTLWVQTPRGTWGRQCRACNRERAKRYYAKKRRG